MPDDPWQKPSTSGPAGPQRPFPPAAYVFGWLVICLVVAEGVRSLVAGVLGTGIILLGLVPFMVWLMHVRPRRLAARRRGR